MNYYLDKSKKIEKDQEKISLFALFLAGYFVLMLCDIFKIGGVGTILKIYAIFLMLFFLVYVKNARMVLDKAFFCIMGYLFMCIISMAYSIDFASSRENAISIVLNFGLLFICQMLPFSKKELDFLLKALVLGSLAVLFSSLVFADFSEAGRLTIKISGDSADQNIINGYLLFAFAFFSYRLIHTKGYKLLNASMSFGLLLFTFLTGSRGALIAYIAIICVLVFMVASMSEDKKKSRHNVILFLFFLIVAVNLILLVLPAEISNRFSFEYINEEGTTGRTDIWKALLNRFFNDNPLVILFGNGIGTSQAYNTYDDHVAHNTFIDILIGTGFIGFIFYVLIFFYMLKKSYVSKNYVIFVALVGFLLMNISLTLLSYKPMMNAFIISECGYRSYKRNLIRDQELSVGDY